MAVLLAGLAAQPGLAAGDGIAISQAWVRPSFGSTDATALYLTIRNTGTLPDAVLTVTTPAAAICELHRSGVEGGIASMRALDELPLPPGVQVQLEPKGTHVMLMQLSHALKAGEHLPLVLRFKVHPPVTADALVSMTAP